MTDRNAAPSTFFDRILTYYYTVLDKVVVWNGAADLKLKKTRLIGWRKDHTPGSLKNRKKTCSWNMTG